MDSRVALPAGTCLDRSYRIERVVGAGGFGITYQAQDTSLGTTVAIKEYCPADFAVRDEALGVRPRSQAHRKAFAWGLTSFLEEARMLARFRHPGIVQVTRIFEAHATAYMVMTFERGESLEAWLQGLGRPPTQDELDRIALALLAALEVMHAASFLHRDIAPDNILIRADASPVLLDFGSARRAAAEASRSMTGVVKAGYSPHEQYSSDSRLQGPWSDIYAVGATLYRAVAGRAPEESTARVEVDALEPAVRAARGTYRGGFLRAVDACLAVAPSARPQSVAALRGLLLEPAPQQAAPRAPPLSRRLRPLLAGARTAVRGVLPRRAGLAAALALAVAGSAYGNYELVRTAVAHREVARADAAKTAAAHQVLLDAERERAVADARRRQAGREDARRRQEAADAAEAEARRNAEAARQAEEARRKAEAEATASVAAFDGAWLATIATRECRLADGSRRMTRPLKVVDGQIRGTTVSGNRVSGRVAADGAYAGSFASSTDGGLVRFNGTIQGNSGGGRWHRVDGICSGTFTMSRAATP